MQMSVLLCLLRHPQMIKLVGELTKPLTRFVFRQLSIKSRQRRSFSLDRTSLSDTPHSNSDRCAVKTHWEELLKEKKYKDTAIGNTMAEGTSAVDGEDSQKRPQFGNRFLEDPASVFQHNAWDNVSWDPDQLEAAKKKVEENSLQPVDSDKKEAYESGADKYWDDFYSQHQNKFFKDRHWLFTEFPELSSETPEGALQPSPDAVEAVHHEADGAKGERDPDSEISKGDIQDSSRTSAMSVEAVGIGQGETSDKNNDVGLPAKLADLSLESDTTDDFPGQSAHRRILEVGCGVGNTIFPILQTNPDPQLFVYGCDFSPVAVDIVRGHAEYNRRRCHAFVCDVSSPAAVFPFPDASLDVIVMIFVLSAISPDRFQSMLHRLSKLLRPGGRILFRDYGRYDMAQLRFKKGRCLSENFYVRGDGTCVYFFTQEELRELFTSAGLVEEQNMIDRRLQVNRGRQLTMYRVWIQCKYRKQ